MSKKIILILSILIVSLMLFTSCEFIKSLDNLGGTIVVQKQNENDAIDLSTYINVYTGSSKVARSMKATEAIKFANENPQKKITLVLKSNLQICEPIVFAKRNLDCPIIFNLNGYSITRLTNSSSAVENAVAISFENSGEFSIKNGTITGGKSKTNGSGIYINTNDATINLNNIVVKDCFSESYGAGIFVAPCNCTLNLTDVTIQNNKANAAGGMYVGESEGLIPKVNLYNKVIITGNYGLNDRANLILANPNVTLGDITGLTEGSNIEIFYDDGSLDYFGYIGFEQKHYFTCDCPDLYIENCYELDDKSQMREHLKFSETTIQAKAKAEVIINGNSTYYYSPARAWNYASSKTNNKVEVKLLADWIGRPDSYDPEIKVLGYGTGFRTGYIYGETRSANELLLNLNKYTIDRQQYKMIENGHICKFEKDGTFSVKNGSITGGNGTEAGCFILLGGSKSTYYLCELEIYKNHSGGDGSAMKIYNGNCDIYISNCTVTENTAESKGAIFICEREPDIYLQGVVIVKNNHGSKYCENMVFACLDANQGDLERVHELAYGSDIYVSTSCGKAHSFTEHSWESSVGSGDHLVNYFHSENPAYIINCDRTWCFGYRWELELD